LVTVRKVGLRFLKPFGTTVTLGSARRPVAKKGSAARAYLIIGDECRLEFGFAKILREGDIDVLKMRG